METYLYVIKLAAPTLSPEASFLEKLITITCRDLDVERSLLFDQCRQSRVKFARWMIWEIMIAVKGYSLADAGRIFRDFDHTTVIHGLNHLPLDLQQNELLNAIYLDIIRHMDLDFEMIIDMRNKREANRVDRKNRITQIKI